MKNALPSAKKCFLLWPCCCCLPLEWVALEPKCWRCSPAVGLSPVGDMLDVRLVMCDVGLGVMLLFQKGDSLSQMCL